MEAHDDPIPSIAHRQQMRYHVMEISHDADFEKWVRRLGRNDAERVVRGLQRLSILGLELLMTDLVKSITGAPGLYELRPTGDHRL